MARLSPKGGVASARRGGSHLRMALLGLVVLGSVLGMLNMAPASLHAELHTSSTRKELRQLTGACLRSGVATHIAARVSGTMLQASS
jgi:hypothetical protein